MNVYAKCFANMAIGLAAAVPASAAYQNSAGGWTVYGYGSCYAFNRPAVEMNQNPWNALTLLIDRDGAITARIGFWPGYFQGAQAAVVNAAVRGKMIEKFQSPGTVIANQDIAIDRALPAPFIKQMTLGGSEGYVTFASGQHSLTFSTGAMAEVLAMLEECRGTLE